MNYCKFLILDNVRKKGGGGGGENVGRKERRERSEVTRPHTCDYLLPGRNESWNGCFFVMEGSIGLCKVYGTIFPKLDLSAQVLFWIFSSGIFLV